MKKKILLLCLVAMMLFVTGCGNKGGSVSGGNEVHKENEKLTDKIKTEAIQIPSGKLVVISKNENKVGVDLNIEVEFYDENKAFLGSAEEYSFGLAAGRETAIEIYDTPENFATYEVFTDATKTYSATFFDKVELTHSNNGENIIVQAKNNADVVIDTIRVAVIYYKDGQPVGYEYDIETDIKAGRNANFELYYPEDKNYRDIPFDTYKVYLNSAESYLND